MRSRVVEPDALAIALRRIGGNLTPEALSVYFQQADDGDIYNLIDIANESRQKDTHLQTVLGVREDGLSQLDCVITPVSNSAKDKEIHEFVVDVVGALEANLNDRSTAYSFSDLLEHLQGANYYGFACAELEWARDGRFLVPERVWPITPRRFRYRQVDGELVQQDEFGQHEQLNLIKDFVPGKFIQHQPRNTGDIRAREGLMRVLLWAALFRNWSIKDWLLLAEIGWKPWRTGTYDKNASDQEIDDLIDVLEQMSSTAVAVHSKDTDVNVEWPKNTVSAGGKSSHLELVEFMGMEMSKVVLGATDLIEPGVNGSRSSLDERGKRFREKLNTDARRVTRTIRRQLIAPLVRYNYGPNASVPGVTLSTQDVQDIETFSKGLVNLVSGARLPMSKSWVYDQIGAPQPESEEDVIEIPINEETGLPAVPEEREGQDQES
jgi:phage gp29-like protein